MWLAFLFLLEGGCIPVAGDRILAADLAPFVEAFRAVDGRAFVAYAPAPGIERCLSRRELAATAGGRAAAPTLPESVCVVRASVQLDVAAVAEAMRTALPADAELEMLHVPSWPLPAGRLEFPPHGLRRTPQEGVYFWKGRLVPHAGGRTAPVAAKVRIRLQRPVLVAGRDIEAGEMVREGDLIIAERDVGLPPPAAVPASGSYAGWKARRRLEAGRPVLPSALQPPPAAHAGGEIVLTSEVGAARVSLAARAATGGRLGDSILVASPLNGARIRARLTAAGQAQAETDVSGAKP